MRAPNGTVHPMTGTFEEVVPPNAWCSRGRARHDGKPLLEG